MNSKKWCISFFIIVILIIILYAGFNIYTDPFGVFGDRFLNWYSYNITNNPRVAKIAYLEKDDNYKKYDSYVIGCSSTSSFPKEALDKYLGGSWYNMIMYGADMLDVEQTVKYVVNNFEAKNILINVFISNGTKYDEEEDNITKNMHAKLNGENLASFYLRYAFVNPNYGFSKIKDLKNDTYLTQPFDVFNIETGAYDKKVRDAESIHDLENYFKAYPIFENYPMQDISMTKIKETCSSIKNIKNFCNEKDVNVIFVMAPVYVDYLKCFHKEEVQNYYEEIAKTTPYWDFTTSSLTYEPRYFYDETHFRNDLGKMCIAKIANADDIFVPNDIGEYVDFTNVKTHVEKTLDVYNLAMAHDKENYESKFNILTFHSVTENPTENTMISPLKFEEDIKYLYDNGFTSISFDDLYKYVYNGIELPKKPILITFDDGYLNNYESAFPILKKYNFKATIFTIGNLIGSKDYYKNTNNKLRPHFSFDEAKEMVDSGLIDIQSHSYDMHQWKEFELDRNIDSSKIRENVLKLENESEQDYIDALKNDIAKMQNIIFENLNKNITAFSYPSGKHDTLSEVVLSQNGILATVTIDEGENTIIKGLPQSLYLLKRYNVEESTNLELLFNY